ncbi:MAG: restriction endonuclease subunit S [Faecalibacterium prausnitzii]|nr:restriction endonuclease subunit S [Faecalibacterium prausnitzii]
MAKLGEICLINPKSCTLRDDTEVSFIPMTKVGEHGEFDASEIKNYSEVKKGFTNFQNGDILFAKITPCMENGKGAIAHNMKNGIGFGSTEFHVLRPDTDKITSEWLYYLTTWKTFRKEAERNMTGSAGQKRVPKTFLENYVVNLPDIDTQKSENKILRKVDDLIFLRKQQLAKLDELVKARFVEMFGEPSSNPMGWLQTTVGAECYYIKDGPHKSLTDVGMENGYPFISVRNIVNGYIDFSTAKYISEADYKDAIKKCCPEKGDILYSKGGTTGIAKLVDIDIKFANWVHLAVLKFNHNEFNGSFFEKMLNCDYCYKQSQMLTKGIANRDLVLSAMAQIKIYKPPILLQNQFAAFVERVDQQKQTVQQSLEKLELMKKALMQEYFG